MLGIELFLSPPICLYCCATNSFETFSPIGWVTALGRKHLQKWPWWHEVILSLWYHIYFSVKNEFYRPSQNYIKGWLLKVMNLLFLHKICQTSSKRKGDSVQVEWRNSVHTWHWKPKPAAPKTEATLGKKQFTFLNSPIPPGLIASAFIDPLNV